MVNKKFIYRSLLPVITSEDFDENGLRWPTSHLSMVFPDIMFYPINMMAEYVDRVTFEIIKKGNVTESNLLLLRIQEPLSSDIESLNATSFGNLGFITMYANNHNLRMTAYNKLLGIRMKVASGLISKMGFSKPFAEA